MRTISILSCNTRTPKITNVNVDFETHIQRPCVGLRGPLIPHSGAMAGEFQTQWCEPCLILVEPDKLSTKRNPKAIGSIPRLKGSVW